MCEDWSDLSRYVSSAGLPWTVFNHQPSLKTVGNFLIICRIWIISRRTLFVEWSVFDPWPVVASFKVNNVVLQQVLLRPSDFSATLFHWYSIFIFFHSRCWRMTVSFKRISICVLGKTSERVRGKLTYVVGVSHTPLTCTCSPWNKTRVFWLLCLRVHVTAFCLRSLRDIIWTKSSRLI